MSQLRSILSRAAYVAALLAAALLFANLSEAQTPIGLYGNLGNQTWSLGTGTSVNVTAAQMVGVASGAPTGAATYTTDSATNLCALFPQVANTATFNFTWDWYLGNTSNFAISLAGGTGVTITAATDVFNPTVVAPNSRRHYRVTLTQCGGTPAASVQGFEPAPSIGESYGSAVAVGPVATGTISIATFGNAVFAGVMGTVPTAAETLTTDTATALCAATPVSGLASTNGFYTDWYLKNTSAGANTATVSAGAGVTVTGTATATQNNVRHFRVIFTNCGAGTQAVTYLSLEMAAF